MIQNRKGFCRRDLKVTFITVLAASVCVSFFSSNVFKKTLFSKRKTNPQLNLENEFNDLTQNQSLFAKDLKFVETIVATNVSLLPDSSAVNIVKIEQPQQTSDEFWFQDPDVQVGNGDLVLGMATGIAEPNLAVFVLSLRRFSNCHIVLFVDIVSERAQKIISANNVTAIMLDLKLLPEHMHSFHPSTYRWMLKRQFLKAHLNNYKRVLLADVRDTVFQGDPFEIVEAAGYYIFKENVVFETEGWNIGWVRDCFGEQMVQKLGKELVVCSGISMGTAEAVLHYLDRMSSIMSTPEFAKCERNGVDQGVHNVLSYNGDIPVIHAFKQTDGPVAHMQNTVMQVLGDWSVKAPESPQLVRVVHQYDRNAELQKALFASYVDWDLFEQVNGTGACQGFAFKKNVEMFQGVGDFDGNTVAARDPGECCAACADNAVCMAFTFKQGRGCWLKNNKTPGPVEVPQPGALGAWKLG